jgi:hypothetical protein
MLMPMRTGERLAAIDRKRAAVVGLATASEPGQTCNMPSR